MIKSIVAFVLAGLASTSLFAKDEAAPGGTPQGPGILAPIKDKKAEYSVRTDAHSCVAAPATQGVAPVALDPGACAFDTFVTAKAIDNGDLLWERRIYFLKYASTAEKKEPLPIVSLAFAGPKTIRVKNTKGDIFELETAHGHMKKPKDPKDYSKK